MVRVMPRRLIKGARIWPRQQHLINFSRPDIRRIFIPRRAIQIDDLAEAKRMGIPLHHGQRIIVQPPLPHVVTEFAMRIIQPVEFARMKMSPRRIGR